ncbi:hypothetical protein PR048_023446 [Dryococelus australis]|uniref:Uncharacterized protein n=1 Tax=Dryococelus australis TaxID=614101 RepID=A0ABQ9GU44_9NEOP|nr:hypothetical protein PR048_023446 [Dryococelus australis]
MGKPTTQLKSSKCPQYSYMHSKNKCPAFGKTCFQCEKLNHSATMCRTSSDVKVVTMAHRAHQEEPVDSGDDEYYLVSDIHQSKHEKTMWHEVVSVEEIKVRFKLDSGSEIDIIPEIFFQKINK